MRLYLASTSPARLALLRAAGLDPVPIPSHVDEPAAVAAEEARLGRPLDAPETVQLLARAKAESVAASGLDGAPLDGLIVGGDSVFAFDGVIHGKPHEPAVARERWRRQRGKSGVLHSGHWVIDSRPGGSVGTVGQEARASVTFADVTDDEIERYVASGEPLEVAGSFTVDSLGGPFISRVEGDPSTVVGLSLSTLRLLVRRLGVDWTDLWAKLPERL